MSTVEQAISQFKYAPGFMLSNSKSAYANKHPNNTIVFNANLCTKQHGKIWYGDLDVTLFEKDLQKLATSLGVDLFVLREMDARFDCEYSPRFDAAVAVFIPRIFE